jgi:hypothetical protein
MFITLQEGGMGTIRVNPMMITLYRGQRDTGRTQLVVNGWSGQVQETVQQIDALIAEAMKSGKK